MLPSPRSSGYVVMTGRASGSHRFVGYGGDRSLQLQRPDCPSQLRIGY